MHARALPGGISYFTPTERAYAECGKPAKRARPFAGAAALDHALAVEVFCTLGACRRWRAEPEELAALWGAAAPAANLAHVASDELGFTAVYRVCLAIADAKTVLADLSRHLARARQSDVLRAWIESGEYGLAVLAPTKEKVDSLRKALARHAVAREAAIILDVGATAETLARFLRREGGGR
jgi:thiamine pyrophosphate-dependent acetolactate synthase large subunit-like protein